MRIERLSTEDCARLGGPEGVAAHLRALVPDGDSVAAVVREIVDRVRVGGDEAVLEYTRLHDTGGSDRSEIGQRPLLVSGEELDEAIKALPLELVAGLQVAIANV